jgi:antitoxin component of RelBE/YafQ-DinJ toxin-antitoxin module
MPKISDKIKDPTAISAVIPSRLKNKAKAISAENGITFNDFINLALQNFVEKYNAKSEEIEKDIIEK